MTRDEAIEVIKEEDSELLQRLSHDELNWKISHYNYMEAGDLIKALRAVVELASTETINRAASGERFYDGFHYALKCVLETIEKELIDDTR